MEEKITQKHNNTIDLCKFIGSLLVIGIHTQFMSDVVNDDCFAAVNAIYRLAVPFFALTTGYFTASLIESGKRSRREILKVQWVRILRLYVVWSAIYFLFTCIQSPESTPLSILHWYAIDTLFQGSHYHLWYILALLVALPIFTIVWDDRRLKLLVIITAIFYLLFSWMYAYSNLDMLAMPHELSTIYQSFTGVMMGVFLLFPYLLMGGAIRKVKGFGRYQYLLIVIYFAMNVIEVMFLHDKGIEKTTFTVSAFAFSLSFFVWVINIRSVFPNSSIPQRLGESSLFIYCIHPMIIETIQEYCETSVTRFVIAALLSCAFAMLYLLLKKILKLYAKK